MAQRIYDPSIITGHLQFLAQWGTHLKRKRQKKLCVVQGIVVKVRILLWTNGDRDGCAQDHNHTSTRQIGRVHY